MIPKMVRVRLRGKELEVCHGTPVGDVLRTYSPVGRGHPVIAAIVHQRCVDLSFPIGAPTEIVPVDYTSREGVLVYRRTASVLLFEAARQLFPGVRVSIGQALGNGYYYDIRRQEPITTADVARLDRRMRELVQQDLPLETKLVSLGEAREIFRTLGFLDKLSLLQTWWEPFVPIVRLNPLPPGAGGAAAEGGFCDIHTTPVAPSTGVVRIFELLHQPPGAILRFPPRGKPQPVRPYEGAPKLFQSYRETREWNEILGVENVGQLNEICIRGESGALVRVAEGLHEKKVAQIADLIAAARDRVKLVLIAGPSASGKTTFSKRLALQLLVNGIRPVALSTDDFYVDRAETPKDEDGNHDFEAIEAIDLPLFNATLATLLRGEEALTPKFEFQTGTRRPRDKWTPMRLQPGQVVVVEGIHGLNDRLTESVPREQKFRIYVSALTQLCVDDHNRIYTSDSRFLRRIVRDRRYRGYSATHTIESWPRVRRGELRNIFPFQEQADVMFNSALVYEQAALRPYAERFLLEVPQDHPSFVDAYRLLKFVSCFVPLFDEAVPQISILREFIGGSAFKY